MEKLQDSAKALFDWVVPAAWIAVACAIAACGLCFVLGSEKGREKAKNWLPAIAIGGILIAGAVTFAHEYFTKVQF